MTESHMLYVWSAYGFSLAMLAGMLAATLRRVRAARRAERALLPRVHA